MNDFGKAVRQALVGAKLPHSAHAPAFAATKSSNEIGGLPVRRSTASVVLASAPAAIARSSSESRRADSAGSPCASSRSASAAASIRRCAIVRPVARLMSSAASSCEIVRDEVKMKSALGGEQYDVFMYICFVQFRYC